MKTITLLQPGQFVSSETPRPDSVAPGEALVRVRRVGVCGTDLHAFNGKQPFFTYPRILGHELGVEILKLDESAPNPQGIKIGDKCCVEPYLNCGVCIACRRGKLNCCASLRVMGVHSDGGMRDTITVPIRKLHKSEKLSFEQLALVETLGIGAHAVARAQLQPGETVLIVGSGPIGLSIVPFAQVQGAKVVVMDTNAQRLAFCKEQFAVSATVDALAGDPLAAIKGCNDGELPTAVFDATGNPNSMMKAFGFVAPGGSLIFVGLFQGDVTFHDPEFHKKEMTLMGTRNSRPEDFARIIHLLETDQIDTRPWITHRVDADRMIEAFPGFLKPENKVIKAVIEF